MKEIAEGFDCKAPLRNINRATKRGFMQYFSERRIYFEDVFCLKYSEENAKKAFSEVEKLRNSINKTRFCLDDM